MLKVSAKNFVYEVKPYTIQYERENVYNSNRSGFQLEVHSGRILTIEGTRQVECVVQSICSTLFNPRFLRMESFYLHFILCMLKEPSETFGPIVQESNF